MQKILILLALSLTACSSVYHPKAPIPATVLSNPYIADLSSPTLLKDYEAIPNGPLKMARRNAILYEYIWLINSNYDVYESGFFSGQAFLNTAGDLVAIGLDAGAAVTGTAAMKSILAVISGSVIGVRASYQKNFFDQASREAIVKAMRASRLTELVAIEQGMASDANIGYSLEQGLLDVEAYYNAGTIVGALETISEASTTQAINAKQALRTLRVIR